MSQLLIILHPFVLWIMELEGTFVDKLQEETSYDQYQLKTNKKQTNYPENYETCLNFIRLLKTIVIVCESKFSFDD